MIRATKAAIEKAISLIKEGKLLPKDYEAMCRRLVKRYPDAFREAVNLVKGHVDVLKFLQTVKQKKCKAKGGC